MKNKIKSAEAALLDSVAEDLNLDEMKKLVREKYRLNVKDDVDFLGGDILVYNNDVAYRLDFDVKMKVSVLCDRKGDSLKVLTDAYKKFAQKNGSKDDDKNMPHHKYEPREDILNTAAYIADMMTEINEED